MTHPTPPKRLEAYAYESLSQFARGEPVCDVRQDESGVLCYYDEALAYTAAREKQARLDALDEAAESVKHYSLGCWTIINSLKAKEGV